MTPLRALFIRELTIRGRAERPTHAYAARLAALARHCRRPPDRIRDEERGKRGHYYILDIAIARLNFAANMT